MGFLLLILCRAEMVCGIEENLKSSLASSFVTRDTIFNILVSFRLGESIESTVRFILLILICLDRDDLVTGRLEQCSRGAQVRDSCASLGRFEVNGVEIFSPPMSAHPPSLGLLGKTAQFSLYYDHDVARTVSDIEGVFVNIRCSVILTM